MLCLGLTGGIGSGKSYVAHIFSALGIPVYEADSQTKALYGRDMVLRSQLIALLGEEVYEGGILRKEVMAAKIFSDKTLLEKVNQLVHPIVMQDFNRWRMLQSTPYVIMESAIILETPFASVADKMATVSAPMEVRMERLYHRDLASAEDARRRMKKQWTDAMREAKSDFVIHSDGKRPLLPQVLEVHQFMVRLSGQEDGGR